MFELHIALSEKGVDVFFFFFFKVEQSTERTESPLPTSAALSGHYIYRN